MATIAAVVPHFAGLKAVPAVKVNAQKQKAFTMSAPTRVTCAVDAFPVVAGSTFALLALGRFAFLPFHRASLAKAGLPKQNGLTHAEAGDSKAQEVEFFTKTNDPAGFTIVDVLAWGALGHALAFLILASANNSYDPKF
eukprot:TRINITY_DN717_c0_g1_i3.p2 TRINITY_DN717_c0_g1~~TRINITY_DN717_c0_g1_i3.p2  ORF type:complete len:139 (-),score=23.54 TRINITY_DN717_c0_g1_i3:233-649(-)